MLFHLCCSLKLPEVALPSDIAKVYKKYFLHKVIIESPIFGNNYFYFSDIYFHFMVVFFFISTLCINPQRYAFCAAKSPISQKLLEKLEIIFPYSSMNHVFTSFSCIHNFYFRTSSQELYHYSGSYILFPNYKVF